MAINPKNYHEQLHACFTCATGGGKGIAVTSLGWVQANKPLVIFDPYGEYETKFGKRKCYQYRSKRGFVRAFANAWQNYQRTKQPFVLSYYPHKANDLQSRMVEVEWFAQLVWAASNGDHVLYALFEEYGECTDAISADKSTVGTCFTGGRKFGLRVGAVFQRSAEVPKTIWGNSSQKYIGAQEFTADAKRLVELAGCSMDEVSEISKQNILFSMVAPDLDGARVKTKVHYLHVQGMRNYQKIAAIVEPNRKRIKNWTQEQKQAHKNSEFKVINP